MLSATAIVSPGSWKQCGICIGLLSLLFPLHSGPSLAETPASAPTAHSSVDTGAHVPLDVDYLRRQINRALPTANITLIPVSDTTVMLTGNVAHAEDTIVVLRVAASVGAQVINALKVGAVQQVQLDVSIYRVKCGLTHNLLIPFLERAGKMDMIVERLETPNACLQTPVTCLLRSKHAAENLHKILGTLKQENLAELFAQPCLLTLRGTAGSFFVGSEQAVPVPAGLGQIGVQIELVGTRLNILPIVLCTGEIHLEIESEISSLSPANSTNIPGATVPGRLTNRTHPTVELEAGQTLVIAGMSEKVPQYTMEKTPILGNLPFIGDRMFTSTGVKETEEEVVILVTPTLVAPEPGNIPQMQRAPVIPAPVPNAPVDEMTKRMDSRLQRLEKEIADLHRELNSLHSNPPTPMDHTEMDPRR